MPGTVTWAVQSKLRDGDAMDRRIKLAIAVFRWPHPSGGASRPVRNRGQAGMLRNAALPEKRATSAVSPMIFAAVTAPHGIP
jgi:hypothetical protein